MSFLRLALTSLLVPALLAWSPVSSSRQEWRPTRTAAFALPLRAVDDSTNRREFLSGTTAAIVLATTSTLILPTDPASAVGPIKVGLKPTNYYGGPIPKGYSIPGQQAMRGMRGLLITVEAELAEPCPKDLDKVGVYGFIIDATSGDSVLANNPDLSSDSGQFTIVSKVSKGDTKTTFEFVGAVPQEKDLSQYDNGIGPLEFQGLRIISYPGGQQYGAINPCEMNEFSDECEAWEAENGAYVEGEYMVKKKKLS